MSKLEELKANYYRVPKGVKEHNLILNYFLALDRSRGLSYVELARVYRLDPSNIYKRINGNLNKKYWNKKKCQI